jgi:hypothetical protein
LEEYGIEEELQLFFKERLVDMIGNGEGTLINKVLTMFDEGFNLSQGTAITIYKHMLARKILGVDMNKEISFNQPCNTVQILANKEVNHYGSNYKHANQL